MNSARPAHYDVILVGSFPPPHGGQAVHIEELSRYLQGNGRAVITLNTGANKEVDAPGVRNVTSSLGLLRTLLFDYEANLVHVHAAHPNEFGKLLPVGVAAVIRKFKCVMTIHSGNVETALGQVAAWRSWLIKRILRRIDRVICVNETTRHYISSWMASSKLKTIPAFSMHFSERRPPAHIEAFLQSHDPVISCVGFFEPTYGFDLAIRAIESLVAAHRRIGLLIMGRMNDSSRYAAMIRDRKLDDHVLLCGNIDRDICLSVIKRSSVFLRPTLYDGDSISVREALALGTRVAASDTEFRPAGVTLFRKGDVQDMTQKLSLLLGDQTTAAKGCHRDATNLAAIERTYSDVLGMTRPRIAVVSTVHDTYDTRIFYKQIASLRASYDVVYFSPVAGAPEHDWIVPLPKSRSKLGRLRTQLALIGKLRHHRADLYLLHDPELLPLGIVLKCLGRKVVWDMHEDTYNDIKTKTYLKPFTRSIVAFIYKLFQDVAYRLLDGFILAEDGYSSYFEQPARTCVVHNYPLLDRLNRYPDVVKSPGTLVYIGSISANRGIFQLLELVARLQRDFPSITLQLIGPFTDDGLEASVRRYIGEQRIERNVQIRGPMKNIEAYGELAKCMVGLALLLPEPNFTKALPTKMFEYMALGLPVVVSNFPLWESIVKTHNVGAAIDPFDTESAAEFVRRALSDPQFYAALSRNARQAAQQYSWETENVILHNFLANILARR